MTLSETRPSAASSAGFSLVETLIATSIMLTVTAVVTSALMGMTKSQKTIWNRTQMHSGVRSATELLQQEVGQAGRITLPGAVTIAGAGIVAVAEPPVEQTVTVSSAAGMFLNEYVTIGAGTTQETVKLMTVDAGTNQISGIFKMVHVVGEPVWVFGAFSSGIVPTNATNGSTATVLKLFGDVNGDGNMVYIEYTCDTSVVPGFLYRNVMALDALTKPAVTAANVLLNNVIANPEDAACFTYQQQSVTAGTPPTTLTYVTDVAITLTVQTEQKDPITNEYQTETKALLNVSPRNVLNVWQLASLNITDRIQPTPATVTTNLLP